MARSESGLIWTIAVLSGGDDEIERAVDEGGDG